MNKQRRKRLEEASDLMNRAKDILEEVKDEEQEVTTISRRTSRTVSVGKKCRATLMRWKKPTTVWTRPVQPSSRFRRTAYGQKA